MPWEMSYDETEVVERAMRAFWEHGYQGTSMDDLVAATEVNRGSLYTAFAGKRTLFLEALRHYDQVHRAGFLDGLARDHAPREAIIAAFEAAGRQDGRDGTPGGCLLVNTMLELAPHDPEIRAFVLGCLKEVEDFFCTMIEAAQAEGTVEPTLAARETAQALLGLFLGLRVLARSTARRSAVDAIIYQAQAMLA